MTKEDWEAIVTLVIIAIVALLAIAGVLYIYIHPSADYAACHALAEIATSTTSMPVVCHQWYAN